MLRALGKLRALYTSAVIDGMSVELRSAASGTLLPEECACCAAEATHRLAARRKDGASLLVGYCDDCAEHQAHSAARGLALSLSSLLLGLVGAAGLPLLYPTLGWFGLCLLVLPLSLSPLLVLLWPAPRAPAPHACRGPAVTWGRDQRLQCASPGYARRLAELNQGLPQRPAPLRDLRATPWLCVGPIIALGAACASYFVYHPLLRIINLGAVPALVAFDGQRLAEIDATSNESPSAGVSLRVPAGEHVLTLSSALDGAALGQVSVDLHSGATHLFAIAAEGTCFWLETNGYGREQRVQPSYQSLTPLGSAEHFWVLPGGIDTWFAPNPENTDPNARSSGGLLTALRQAPCSEAPQEVRFAQ